MEIQNGYQQVTYNGCTIHVYKQTDKLDIGMMSSNGVTAIDKLDDDHVHYCKINANYFNLSTGEHYGVEQSFTKDDAPKSDKYLCVYVDNDNKIHYCKSSDYWLSKKDVKFAMTPFCVLLADGKEVDDISTAFGDKRLTKNSQTCLMQLADGKYAFAVVKSGMTPYDCRKFALQCGATFLACFDSGGSSQMMSDKGVKRLYTGRALPNVLTFYKKEETDSSSNPDNNTIEQLINEIALLKTELDTQKQLVETYSNKVSELQSKLNQIKEIVK